MTAKTRGITHDAHRTKTCSGRVPWRNLFYRQMECYRIRRLVEVSPLLSVYRIACRWVNHEPPDPHPPAPYQKRNVPDSDCSCVRAVGNQS